MDEENDVDEAVESGRLTSEGDIEDTEADMDISDSVISVLLPSETTDGASDTALMLDDILRGLPWSSSTFSGKSVGLALPKFCSSWMSASTSMPSMICSESVGTSASTAYEISSCVCRNLRFRLPTMMSTIQAIW